MTRKVCYITGTRADFGLMQSTLQAIKASPALELHLIVTGMHLSPDYGDTVRDIVAAGFSIDARVPVEMQPASGATMARNIGRMLGAFVDALETIKPDLVLLLGDRGEMLAGALAAIHLNLPVVHIHGGERSGTVDEPVRHAISKLSHFHLAATADARDRLVRMGENPDHVLVCGAPGLDGLVQLAALPRETLAHELALNSQKPIALLIYHPVLQEAASGAGDMERILAALLKAGLQVVALLPNADAGSNEIRAVLEARKDTPGIAVVTHFTRERFAAWMAACDLMIGNSSAGILEAASFGTPVVNVGARQNLRERNANVRDSGALAAALDAAVSDALRHGRTAPANLYGDGKAGARIVDFLTSVSLDSSILSKTNGY